MNINQLNRIKTINVDERIASVEPGTGTFKEILDKVMCDELIPIVNGAGNIVGISYDSKVESLIEDNIAKIAFEKRYRGKPIMEYTLSALKLKATAAEIAEVQEDDAGVRVILASGEVVVIEERVSRAVPRSTPTDTLPSELEIDITELENTDVDTVKKYLRDKYDRYLAGGYRDPEVDVDEEAGKVTVSNIRWGRKR